jgi:hypothetical protein
MHDVVARDTGMNSEHLLRADHENGWLFAILAIINPALVVGLGQIFQLYETRSRPMTLEDRVYQL